MKHFTTMDTNPFYNGTHGGPQQPAYVPNAPFESYQRGHPQMTYANQPKSNPFDNGMAPGYHGATMLQPGQIPPQPPQYTAGIMHYPQNTLPHQVGAGTSHGNNIALTNHSFNYEPQPPVNTSYANQLDPFNLGNAEAHGNQSMHASSNFLSERSGFSQERTSINQNSTVSDDLLMFDPLAEEERKRQKAEASRQALILDRASFLCRSGMITESDESLLKGLLTSGDKELENKLIHGMKDGNIEKLKEFLQLHRQRLGIREETRRESTDSDGTITDGDDQGKSLYTELVEAQVEHDKYACPHPKSGGFKETVPESMYMVGHKFVGTILMRVSSKKLFRKWKPVFFVLDKKTVKFYDSARLWELKSEPREIYEIHPLMQICKPTLKRTYSVMDDGRRVYYCVFRENPPEAAYGPSGMKVNKFSRALESRRICKFGAHTMLEVSAFAHALHGVIGAIQRKPQIPVTSAYP